MLFGQKPTKAVRSFTNDKIPDILEQKPVIGFATYLLLPVGTLNFIKIRIESRNGKISDLVAKGRSNKTRLVDQQVANYVHLGIKYTKKYQLATTDL